LIERLSKKLKIKKKRGPKKKREKYSNLYDPSYWLGSIVPRNQNTNPKTKNP
jgi:hypothetical protein